MPVESLTGCAGPSVTLCHHVFPGAGMVVDWEQETGLLMSSGDVRVVRIWDTDREMKVQVSPRPAVLREPGAGLLQGGARGGCGLQPRACGRPVPRPSAPASQHN